MKTQRTTTTRSVQLTEDEIRHLLRWTADERPASYYNDLLARLNACGCGGDRACRCEACPTCGRVVPEGVPHMGEPR